MNPFRSPLLCTCAFTLAALLSGTGSAAAQTNSGSTAPPVPDSFVYVSSPAIPGPSGNATNSIQGWSVAADGSLKPVPGSPFTTPDQIGEIVAGRRFLFSDMIASGTSRIGSWTIAPSGALTLITTTPSHSIPSSGTTYNNGATTDFTDRTDTTLYDFAQAYAIQPTGGLRWIGSIADSSGDYIADELSFTGNDIFAYSSDCQFGSQNFWAFKRSLDGTLTNFNSNANLPVLNPNPEGTTYCPTYGAAVPAPDSRHVVFSLQVGSDPYSYNGVNNLAVYTINPKNGQLSTTNTSATMPQTTVGQATDYKFDPLGRWFAIAGSSGLELFQYRDGVLFGGATLLSNDNPSQIAWDGAGHLFAISQDSGSLYVFNVVNGIATPAPGSPWTVPLYSYLTVHSRPGPLAHPR